MFLSYYLLEMIIFLWHSQVMLSFKSIIITALCSAIITAVTSAPTAVDFALDRRSSKTVAATSKFSCQTPHTTTDSPSRGKEPTFSVPTVEDFVGMFKGHVKTDQSLFWCLPRNSKTKAKKYAKKNNLFTVSSYLDRDLLDKANKATREVYVEFWDRASQAFAQVVSGKVYVLLPPLDRNDAHKAKNWYEGCVWARIEWPELRKNQHAHVYRISMSQKPTEGIMLIK